MIQRNHGDARLGTLFRASSPFGIRPARHCVPVFCVRSDLPILREYISAFLDPRQRSVLCFSGLFFVCPSLRASWLRTAWTRGRAGWTGSRPLQQTGTPASAPSRRNAFTKRCSTHDVASPSFPNRVGSWVFFLGFALLLRHHWRWKRGLVSDALMFLRPRPRPACLLIDGPFLNVSLELRSASWRLTLQHPSLKQNISAFCSMVSCGLGTRPAIAAWLPPPPPPLTCLLNPCGRCSPFFSIFGVGSFYRSFHQVRVANIQADQWKKEAETLRARLQKAEEAVQGQSTSRTPLRQSTGSTGGGRTSLENRQVCGPGVDDTLPSFFYSWVWCGSVFGVYACLYCTPVACTI